MAEKSEKNKSGKKQKTERLETLMRILVGIVSGVILYVWWYVVILFFVINFFYTLITGKRLRELAEMSEIWSTQFYTFIKYMSFLSNKRPFPFEPLEKSMSKFE